MHKQTIVVGCVAVTAEGAAVVETTVLTKSAAVLTVEVFGKLVATPAAPVDIDVPIHGAQADLAAFASKFCAAASGM